MSFLPASSGRSNSLKRHSLANIAEAWKGHSLNSRRGSMTSCRMSVGNALDCAARHEFLESIQIAVVQLFQKKKLQEFELASLQESVRSLVQSDAGPLIFDYFKDKLLKKGMVILRECMKNDLGSILLKKLSDQWHYFYTQIIPVLQAMLYPLPAKDVSIRKVTMLEFRDVVVLKVGIEDTLNSIPREDVPSPVIQMLLVLQGVHDGYPPTENYAKLEKLVARVVTPYLGYFGYYEGTQYPVLECTVKPSTRPKQIEKTEAYDGDIKVSRPKSANIAPIRSFHHSLHHKHGNGHIFNQFLEPVFEQETTRRHSIDS